MYNRLANFALLLSRRGRLAWHRWLLRRRIRRLEAARLRTLKILHNNGYRYERICRELIQLRHWLRVLR